MTAVEYKQLSDPGAEIAAAMERWDNDPELVPLIRHCSTREDQEKRVAVTVDTIKERLLTSYIYLIYAEGELVGELSYQVDPPQCYRKVEGTAWLGISIGEKKARHRGIGAGAMAFIEDEIRRHGLKRTELGVFEFNENAQRLYRKLSYREIGRIESFTYWNGKMWQDIRMEKLL